jgi:hypothetical protein
MLDEDLPAAAIVDAHLFTNMDGLHRLLARLRRTDPLPWIEPGLSGW